ncbi:hypothetical protein EDB81DRAFT_773708 [Dactylonectria macrodidyma]|uniref:Zn(2)-C6 fungal-type domain-containing protein n=1 Tax=Dactylonectria macrodidyma TaxID=307937 RepID=A0A9P9FV80_9HYPO|nr:hypothetical protein EDB81DRAFT_773708 [Dactylonectria macrodidyma]
MDNETNVQSPQSSARQRKKILNACISCRNRKLRCSGRHPCERCTSRKEICTYEEKERKVTVSADYLDQLRARVKSLETQLQASQNPCADVSSPNQDDVNRQNVARTTPETPHVNFEEPALHAASEGLTNTLVTSEPQIKVHRYGHAAYLGHSSTLCFSRNVRNLLQRSSPIANPSSVSVEREDASYTTPLPPIALDLASIPLPRLSYAEYLTNTVVIHAGSLYSLFDTAVFLERLREFYDERARGGAPNASLWHIQMLLILGLGKSILSREHSQSGPSGMIYFTLAIEAMPDIRRLYEDPLLSIEILCLATLFMHATDLLQESYVTIGKALRIAVTKIMNVLIPETFQPPNVEYQRRLWWTLYCIDRKSAAMLGSTLIIRDDDISIPFPTTKEGDEVQNVFATHVTLSSHLGKILDVIYGVHNQQQRNFIVEVKAILSRLADTLVVLREHLFLDLHTPSQPLSRDAATLHLLLHQCVILTVRPVLFSLLKPLLSLNSEESSRPSSSSVESMLRMCVESAIHILKIMFTLKHQTMCDLFLPYDIDALFSAAFALILIDIIRPANELLWDLPQVMNLLEEYVSRHIAPAQSYRSDLLQVLELHTKIRSVGNTSLLRISDDIEPGSMLDLAGYAILCPAPNDTSPDPVWSHVRHDNDGSAPPHLETIMTVIDDLNVDGADMLDAAMLDGDWMWEVANL